MCVRDQRQRLPCSRQTDLYSNYICGMMKYASISVQLSVDIHVSGWLHSPRVSLTCISAVRLDDCCFVCDVYS